MKNHLGKLLTRWRIQKVLPLIDGHFLDIGCGMNELVRSYQNGIGVDVYQWGDVDLFISDTNWEKYI